MTKRAKTALLDWLRRNGAVIDRDAAVSIAASKGGLVITFGWTFDDGRHVRLSFSGISAAARNAVMTAWLNGEFLPPSGQGA